MLQIAIENTRYFLLGATFAATPFLILAGFNELALRVLVRKS